MKQCALLAVALFFPILLWAQNVFELTEAVPSNTLLLRVADSIVMIQPIDKANAAQKWVGFDKDLVVTGTKKLITPDATELVGQTYLEGNRTIIRIDQFIVDDIFFISAFVFDGQGNIIKKQEIDLASAAKKMLLQAPFYVIQSPDKRYTSFLQLQSNNADSVLVSVVSIDETLATKTSNQFVIPFDDDLEEMLMPLNDNKGSVYIITAERFDSYTLGSALKCYVVTGHDQPPNKTMVSFDRKKLKNHSFQMSDSSLAFSALFSDNQNKKDVVGILYGHYNLRTGQMLVQNEKTFDDAFKQKLKKQFGNEGRKGNILNYLSVLPPPPLLQNDNSYALLLPALEKKVAFAQKSVPMPGSGLEEIHTHINHVNSLVGTQPQGYSKPMNHAEASTYAAMRNAGRAPSSNSYYETRNKKSKPQRYASNNLLLLQSNGDHQLVKTVMPADPHLQFFAYLPLENHYNTLHYQVGPTGEAILKLTGFDAATGAVTEKSVFEHKQKVLLPGYSYTITDNCIIAFYRNKSNDRMGLVKIRLE